MSRPSVQTVATTVRITRTQQEALRKHSVSLGVIVRVLLQHWLEDKINIDEAIAEENKRTEDAINKNYKNRNSIAA